MGLVSTPELLQAIDTELTLPLLDGRAGGARGLPSRLGRSLRGVLHTHVRQGVLTLLDQAFVSGTNFLTTVILGRVCLRHELGLYAMGFSLLLMLMGVSRALVWMPYITHAPHRAGRRLDRYTGSVTVHMAVFCLLTALGLAVAAALTGLSASGAELSGLLGVLAVAAALMLSREYVRRVYLARLDVLWALVFDVGLAGLQLAGLGILVLGGLLSARGAYGVIALACGLGAAGWLLVMRHRLRIRRRQVWVDWRRNWKSARWMFPAALITVAGGNVYPWILALFHGAVSVGAFTAAQGVIFFANPLLLGMCNFFGPFAAHTYARGGVHRLSRAVWWSTLGLLAVMGLFCAVVSVWGGELVQLIYGPRYAGQGEVVRALAYLQLAQAAGIPVSFGLLALHRADYELKTAVIQLAVTFTLGLWCVERFGAAGVGYAGLVGCLAAVVLQWFAFRRIVHHASANPVWGEQVA